MYDTQRERDVDEALSQCRLDNEAVDKFARAMKAKLAMARIKGKIGWDNKETCSGDHIANLFWKNIRRENEGNLLDLANFLMFLHVRGEHASKIRRNAPSCNTCGNAICFNSMHRFNDESDLGILSCRYWYGKDIQDEQ